MIKLIRIFTITALETRTCVDKMLILQPPMNIFAQITAQWCGKTGRSWLHSICKLYENSYSNIFEICVRYHCIYGSRAPSVANPGIKKNC